MRPLESFQEVVDELQFIQTERKRKAVSSLMLPSTFLWSLNAYFLRIRK